MTRLQRFYSLLVLIARRRFNRVERLRREMRESADHQRNLGTRHDLLLGTRTAMCRYHPDNGGDGRMGQRHFEDYVEDILGPDWGDDEAAAAYQRAEWTAVREPGR